MKSQSKVKSIFISVFSFLFSVLVFLYAYLAAIGTVSILEGQGLNVPSQYPEVFIAVVYTWISSKVFEVLMK